MPGGEIAAQAALCLTDNNSKVRQAALDVLAAIAQLGLPGEVLESAVRVLRERPQKEAMLTAVRARLARRRLASVSADGHVTYATTATGRGADAEWV